MDRLEWFICVRFLFDVGNGTEGFKVKRNHAEHFNCFLKHLTQILNSPWLAKNDGQILFIDDLALCFRIACSASNCFLDRVAPKKYWINLRKIKIFCYFINVKKKNLNADEYFNGEWIYVYWVKQLIDCIQHQTKHILDAHVSNSKKLKSNAKGSLFEE